MPLPLLCRNKGKYVQCCKGWMETGGTGDGDDWFDFSCSVCRVGGRKEFIAKVMLLKGWLKVRGGMLVVQVPYRV